MPTATIADTVVSVDSEGFFEDPDDLDARDGGRDRQGATASTH